MAKRCAYLFPILQMNEGLRCALYNCNWVDAPPKIRKLVLLLMIKATPPSLIEGRPFYAMNFDLLANVSILYGVHMFLVDGHPCLIALQVMKGTYYFLTILIDFIG